MTYKEQFVAVVKCMGKILREQDGAVRLPFGSEYSLLLKNLAGRQASVRVFIDGTDVLNGNSLIAQPNSELELERFLENLDSGNHFRFIQKTEQIQDHRGDKVDDGLIRVEFDFEKEQPIIVETHHYDHYHPWPYRPWPWPYRPWYSATNTYTSQSQTDFRAVYCANSLTNAPTPDEGITVKGSVSQQQFHSAHIGQLEGNPKVIILRLTGYHERGIVSEPVTIQTKLTCSTCGKSSPSSHRYCAQCGTFLTAA